MSEPVSLLAAVDAVQGAYEGDIEYDLSDNDAAAVAEALLNLAGVAYVDDARPHWKAERDRESREYRAREKARRAAMTPEQREADDRIAGIALHCPAVNEALRESIVDSVFSSSAAFAGTLASREQGGDGQKPSAHSDSERNPT